MADWRKPYAVSVIALTLTFAAVVLIANRSRPVVIRTNLDNIPMQIGPYRATEDHFPDAVYEELNADLHVYRHYRKADGSQVSLYIGYYGTAKGGRTGHNPYACLPGAGWGIVEARKTTLARKNDKVRVNAILAQKGDVYETVLHWYQSDKDKVLATGIQQNIQRLVGRIKYNRDDGAYIQLSTLSTRDALSQAEERVTQFAEQLLPIIPNYWPEER